MTPHTKRFIKTVFWGVVPILLAIISVVSVMICFNLYPVITTIILGITVIVGGAMSYLCDTWVATRN